MQLLSPKQHAEQTAAAQAHGDLQGLTYVLLPAAAAAAAATDESPVDLKLLWKLQYKL
jgi:hypothetical protein